MRYLVVALGSALAAAAILAGLSAASGAGHALPASGIARVIGPYPCDYTQIPNPGDTIDLFDPPPNLVVLAAWPNPRTITPFQGDGSEYIEVGQASELPDAYWAIVDDDLAWDNVKGGSYGTIYPTDDPLTVRVSPVNTLSEPVACQYHSSDGAEGPPLTGGHVDWYFEVSVPAVP